MVSASANIFGYFDCKSKSFGFVLLFDFGTSYNLYTTNYTVLTKGREKKQIIDSYGKLRGLVFDINDTEEATILVLPSAPINLPSTETISYTSLENATKFMNWQPSAITKNKNGFIDGLWYSFKHDEDMILYYGIYFPIKPSKDTKYKNLEIGKTNPYIAEGRDILYRYNKLKRDLEIIYQLMKWFYLLANQPTLQSFIKNYIDDIQLINEDSIDIYDFSKLDSYLPEMDSIEEAIKYIKANTSGFISENNKIYLYSEKFYEGIIYHLKIYIKQIDGLVMNIPSKIIHKYLSINDFHISPYVVIFLNDVQLQSWLESKTILSLDKLFVVTDIFNNNIDDKLANRIDPYIYKENANQYYLIQNVLNNELERALNICKTWHLKKVNLGHNAEPIQNKDLDYVIYEPITDGKLLETENHSDILTDFYGILNYGKDKYAAIIAL